MVQMGYIVLHNDEPEKERARYYALTWSPAVAGHGWAVERAWGPLHAQRRQQKTTLVDDQAGAQTEVLGHLKRRLRHGYVVADAGGAGRELVDRHVEERA